MAEPRPDDAPKNTTDNSGTKSVLVCLGERKREVSFACHSSYQELEALSVAVRDVYSDVLKGEEDLIFQVKGKEWNGEFIDICGPVPDRAVLLYWWLLLALRKWSVKNNCIRLALSCYFPTV